MKSRTKRQQKRIDYFLREKESRREKQELLHNKELPKFIEKEVPVVRRLSRNIDQLLVIASFVSPPLKPGIIDRLLVVAEIEGIEAVICLNKSDLVEYKQEIKETVKIYKNIGYTVIVTSAKTRKGVKELQKVLNQKKSAFAGHSGVGKSSLLNALQPDLNIAVGDVSDWTNKGTHTTTKVTTYALDEETILIDLPGLKKLDFIDIHRDEARFFFREFKEFSPNCKFRDCLHLSEHKCAVKEAVQTNQITQQRYQSYCNFVDSL